VLTLDQVNATLAPLGVRVHRVPRRGLVVWIIMAPAYVVSWGRWDRCVADLKRLEAFQ
jgi:hypothetical protein